MSSKKKPEHGLLIDYEYCTGCHACEVACAQEFRRPAGIVKGIEVLERLVRQSCNTTLRRQSTRHSLLDH